MYEQVFNFNSRPFTSTPYVKHYFSASAMNQAFGQASICIERGSGPVVAIGDIGTGKSLLLAKLESEYQTKFQIVDLVCSGFSSRREFLQNILFQIGKPFNMDSETELRFAVIESAQPTEAFPNGLLLLVDDAEMLTVDIFDELRALSNIVIDGSPQVRLVLAGRRALEELLANPALASFSQRIASRVFLSNLTRDETAAYVVEHINRVGGNGQTMFPAETAAKLHDLTDGCPRLINQVCDFGLILAGTRGSTTVSAALIEEAWNDVQALPMGSGSVQATAPDQTTDTNEENEWTLIEFGQLEDDSPQPQDATVYDFGSSKSDEETSVNDLPQEEELAAESPLQSQEADPSLAIESRSCIDPELGIDLGSLQAMQDAASANNAETPAEPISLTDETTQEIEAVTPNTNLPEASSADDAARTAMEQQLAAVFGTSSPSATPEPEASDMNSFTEASPAPEMGSTPPDEFVPATSELQDALALPDAPNVPSEPDVPSQPDETSSIAGTATGAAFVAGAFAAAAHSFTPERPEAQETPAVEDGFKPATSALSDQESDSEQPDLQSTAPAELNLTTPEVQPAPSFTPAFPADETASFVPATQPIETVQTELESIAEVPVEPQVEDPAVNEAVSKLRELTADASANPTLPTASNDPFGESFAVEASVPHRPTSEIIEQNQNALKISSADLAHVQPTHAPTPDEIIHPTPSDAAEANEANENAPVGMNWFPNPSAADQNADAQAAAQPAANEETTGDSTESFSTLSEAPNAADQLANQGQAEQPAKPKRGFSIMPVSESAAPEITPQPVEQEPAAESTPPAPVEPSSFSDFSDAPAPVETSSDAPAAEPETPDTTHTHDDNVVSDEISRQADAILARLHKASQPAAIGQEEQILADIQSQQREVADSQLLGEEDSSPASLPIPTAESHQDDSEMLVVHPEVSSTADADDPETFPIADSPISSGRASRMDYEQLFDRLRNLPDGDKK